MARKYAAFFAAPIGWKQRDAVLSYEEEHEGTFEM